MSFSVPLPSAGPTDFFNGSSRRITHAVFDFDGTLSWLRHGWPEMMLETFGPYLPDGQSLADDALQRRLLGKILALNGKPTIQQMAMFQEYAHSFGAVTPEPESLRQAFQATLDAHIKSRAAEIQTGSLPPDAYVVAGARPFLEFLVSRGVRLYVLSSTIEPRVLEEAELLGLAEFFEGRIFGSPSDPTGFTKRAVFERILEEAGIDGSQLLAIGDGPVEIAEAKALGGLAIAVCTDEDVNGSGVMDPHKREQLLAAGADVAIADFRNAVELVAPLFES
jgi:phosphoglycolate phosphatase-like HAD superfamily hydrolase